MASITRSDEQWRAVTGSVSYAGDTQVRVWKVTFDGAEDGGQNCRDALVAPGLPHIYDLHPHNNYIYVLSKTGRMLSPTMVEVTVNYGVRSGSSSGGAGSDDPLSRPAEISVSDVNDELPVDVDRNDAAIVNSAGEAFDPPLTRPSNDKRITITRNRANYTIAEFLDYKDRINSAVWEGLAAGTVRYVGESAVTVQEGEVSYWRVTHELLLRPDGWTRKILDQGFRETAGTDSDNKPKYTVIKDTAGTPVSQPVLLNGSGKKLVSGADPVILEFELNAAADFNALQLLA